MSGKISEFVLILLGVVSCLCVIRCGETSSANKSDNQVENEDDSTLVSLEFAQHFSVYSLGNDTIIEVSDEAQNWKLKASKVPGKGQVKIPLEKITCMSTSHLFYFSELDALEKVKAVSFIDNIKDSAVVSAVSNGNVKSLNHGGAEYDAELVFDIQPDLFTTYPFGSNEFERINNLGVVSLHFTEYLEPLPLGRAEWIKLSGFLLDKEEEATEYFNKVKESYMVTKLNGITQKKVLPKVMCVNGYANKWSAPNGNSIVSHFIEDAGGEYVFKNDTASGNLTLDFERVYELANSSDFWASVVFSDSVNLETFIGKEQRLNDTKVIKDSLIFYCNALTKDYFGKGVLEPHLILEDVQRVLFPDSLALHEPHYFEHFSR